MLRFKIIYNGDTVSIPCSGVHIYGPTTRLFDVPEESYHDLDAILPDSFNLLAGSVMISQREHVAFQVEEDVHDFHLP